jgi:hypothetical protein
VSGAMVLADLQSRGLSLSVEGSTLRVTPEYLITPEVKELIAEHKAELFISLWQAEDRTCPACGMPAMRRMTAMKVHGHIRWQCPRCARVCWRSAADVGAA